MSDARTTKNVYMQIINEHGRECHKEFVYMLERAIDEEILGEGVPSYDLLLHGNKRNERNEIYRKKITDKDIETFYLLLKTNTFITKIDFGYNLIADEGAAILGKLLQESTSLESLILSYNDITVTGIMAIAKGLQMNESLKLLNIDGNKIEGHGGMAVAGALQVNTTLEKLYLNNTGMNTQSLVALTTVLKSNKSLKVIDIGRPILHSEQEETTVHFSKMLQVNRTLQEVHLSKHCMKNFGVERLTEHIADNFSLLHLDLSCNQISRDGIKCIATYLKENPPLQILNLAYNRSEDDGAIYLSEALACGNLSLQTLVMCSNSLTGKGLCSLASSLASNTTLEKLYIWGNKFETDACQAFYELTTGSDIPRLTENDTDVRGYIVDGVPSLARLQSPY